MNSDQREKARVFVAENRDKLTGVGICSAVVGASLTSTSGIVAGVVSFVGTLLMCWAIWPLIRRWG